MFIKIIKLFIPEIIFLIYRKLFKTKKKKFLFDGHSKLFKDSISKETIYGEYGCGLSTCYVSNNFEIPIYSAESDLNYINKTKKLLKFKNTKFIYVNIGIVEEGSFGRPLDFSMRENFMVYANSIWENEYKPNFVLIDGRLRVLCFLISLKRCNNNTTIIFDDYVTRKHYHIVEELIKPKLNDMRQSLFYVEDKKKIDTKKLEFLINKFNYVLD